MNVKQVDTTTAVAAEAFVDDGSVVGGVDEGSVSTHEEEKIELAKLEQKWVFWLRTLTTVVLLSVAISVCLAVFFQGRRSETADYEQDFVDLGEKLVTSFEAVVEQRFGVIHSFSQDLTSQANGVWPFFTPPNFSHRAETVAILAQLMYFFLVPLVSEDNRKAWDKYSVVNQGWRTESLSHEFDIPIDEVNAMQIFPTITCVHCGGPPISQDGPGPYFPIWSFYPSNNQSMSNVDIYADPEHKGPIDEVLATGKPSFEVSYDYWDPDIERDNRYSTLIRNQHVEYRDDPHAVAFFPIFDGFGENKTVSALFLVIIYWRTYFDGLLPPGADGIVVILENTCGQQYTYQVDGIHSRFIGHGDLHDPKYDYLGTGTNLVKHDNELADHKGCSYSIRVYPSQQFEDSHYTRQPVIYSCALASLFVFTSAVFLLYDYMVERRQRIVMTSATQSGMLVNHLFPESVRDQLYREQLDQAQAQEKDRGVDWEMKGQKGDDAMMIEQKEAIASLYPHTTIFFADLAGFTKWSSSRTPAEVFQLLEALYGEFDKIANKRRVFKVETIGDCYVAVTGIPKPQDDHAVIMCRFAADCMARMNAMTGSLVESLGDDTADLAMRVGLHSGPVTAGVLRGQKARFQLFGDTVNTASRMESNGVKSRIHVSAATAEELRARGKGTWLTPREDKIVAKGKGEMQTYWVDVLSSTATTTGSTMTTNLAG